jgi:hypothetical protein
LIFLNKTRAYSSYINIRIKVAKLDIINKKRYKTCSYSENKHIKGKDLIMSKLDKDQVIAAFTEAYAAANGKDPTIVAKGGWYSVDGGKNIRLADLNAMIAELSSSSPVKESKPVAEKSKKVTEKKPATEKNAAKAPARIKAKRSKFSVKTFWAEKILEQSKNSKLPR